MCPPRRLGGGPSSQDAYERAGKDLGLEQLIAIGNRSAATGRLNEAHAAYELAAVERRMSKQSS